MTYNIEVKEVQGKIWMYLTDRDNTIEYHKEYGGNVIIRYTNGKYDGYITDTDNKSYHVFYKKMFKAVENSIRRRMNNGLD